MRQHRITSPEVFALNFFGLYLLLALEAIEEAALMLTSAGKEKLSPISIIIQGYLPLVLWIGAGMPFSIFIIIW
jgi:hypothetical protein